MEGRDKHIIKMAALGRQFKLGGLYDYLNDKVLKDSPEWKPRLSDSAKEVNTEFKIKTIITESDSDKWEQMGLDEHLKASTLAGLIDKCRGASSYLNDQNNSGQVSQTVVIRIKTKKEDLDLSTFDNHENGEDMATDSSSIVVIDAKGKETKNVGKKKESPAAKLEADTHVIVGIVYGAEIYCVLTQELADEADEDAKDDAKSNLVDWAGQMERALEDNRSLSQFKEDFEREERQQLTRMKCRVYADIQTKSFRECGFFDAYKYCLEVIEQTQKTGIKNKAVPIVYKLCPLKIVTNSVEAARDPTENREVNADLLAQCYDIWSQLEKISTRAKALISSSKKVNSSPLRQFTTFIEKYQELMKKRMQAGVLKARKSTDDDEDDVDEEFEKIIKIVENHLYFKPASLEKWLSYKAAEAEMIKDVTKLKDITFAATADQLKKQLTESFDKKYALVLQIPKLDERTNEILKKMGQVKNEIKLMAANHDDDDEENYECEEDDDLPWYMIPAKRKHLMEKLREFSDYAAKNQETECQFLITLGDKKNGFQYSVYEGDQVLKDNIQLPGPPTDLKVQLERVNEKTKSVKIQLKWKYKDVDYPHQFLVEYRPKDSLDSWTQQNTSKPGQKQVSITCKRDSILEFRVAADTCIGRSQFSTIFDMESTSFDDGDDSDDQESVYSSVTQSTYKQTNQSKMRPDDVNKRPTKMNQEDYEDSDRESEFTSVSKSTWNTKQNQGQNAKIRTDELFQSTRSTTGNRTKSFVSDHTLTDIESQINSTQNFDSETLIEDRPRFASSILNRCKKIGDRNGMQLYAVRLNESKSGSKQNVVRRFVFGQPGPRQGQHKTILVMGATGSGKTTLINGMINYIFGVEWDDPFRFHLIEEQLVGQSQANSQTSIITAYDIYHMDGFRIPYSLTIVDTPGYGDTKGLDRDKEITDMVHKFFEDKNGIQELDVIGFVAQASLPRLTPTQIYIFDSVLSIFGNDVKENINFLLTFADSQDPPVLSAINQAGLPCPTNSDGDPLHHKFNNSGFFCSSRPEASLNSSLDKFNRFFWKMGMDNFQKFFSTLATMKTKSLSLTKQVLDERKKLEATVDGLQPLIKIGLSKMEELRKTNQVISTSQAQIDANQDVRIEVEVTVPKKVEIPAGQYLTNCNKCYVTCHNPCGIPNDDGKVNCWAMDFSQSAATRSCRICPEKCIWNMHANQPYCWEYVKEMQVTSSDAIKEKYEAEMNKKLSAKELIKLLERDIKENEKEVLAKVDIVASCIKRLDEIALRPNPFSTPQYIDLIIDAEEQEKKPGFKERIQSLQKLRQMAVITSKVRSNQSLLDHQGIFGMQHHDDNQTVYNDDDDDSYDGASLVSAATNHRQSNSSYYQPY